MTRYFLSFMACAVLSFNSSAMTLQDAVKSTLQTNPDIQASRLNVEAAREVYREAKGNYLPSVDVILAGGREKSNNSTTRALNVNDLTLTRKERGVTITQLLYDGSATRNLVAQQSAQVDAALARLSTSKENTSLKAVQVYLEMLRRQEVVDLAKENLAHHDTTLKKIRERFESGVGTRVDVVQTEGREAQSRSNLLLAQRDVNDGMAQFYRVVGKNPDDLSQPGGVAGLPKSLDEALQIAYAHNPQLVAAQSQLAAAVASHKQVVALFKPRFDLVLGATRNDDVDGQVGPNDDNTALVRMTYNLYRGGSDKARLREAQAREYAARETVASVKRGVTQDVTVVWDQLKDLEQRLDYLKAHVDSTRQVLKVYNEQLSLGKRTLLDLLDVQNELLRAQVAYVTGRYTEILARYQLLASTGELLDKMGLDQ